MTICQLDTNLRKGSQLLKETLASTLDASSSQSTVGNMDARGPEINLDSIL